MERRDPGWKPALRQIRPLSPIVGSRRLRRAPTLIALRAIFLRIAIALILLGVVLWLVRPVRTPDRLWFAFVVLGEFLAGVAGIASFDRLSPTAPSDPKRMAAWYRGRFFIKLGLFEATPLMGFVGVFVTGRFWMYPLGVGLAALLSPRVAPTARSLERDQDALRTRGSPVDLLQVLTESLP